MWETQDFIINQKKTTEIFVRNILLPSLLPPFHPHVFSRFCTILYVQGDYWEKAGIPPMSVAGQEGEQGAKQIFRSQVNSSDQGVQLNITVTVIQKMEEN